MKAAARRALVALARTGPGKRAFASAIFAEPKLGIEPLRRRAIGGASFGKVEDWPPSVGGFEDLVFLFSCGQLNMKIALLSFDEAAYLYRLVRGLGPATIAEIGRFQGGSTFLIASASAPGSELYSYDLYVEEDVDAVLHQALRRYGLEERVHLLLGDSRAVEPPPRPCDLVFVDGDHSYEGARADYEHWRPGLRAGGHLVFHDAAAPYEFTTGHEEVMALVAEIERDDGRYFARRGGAGSIVHFTRTDAAAPWTP